MRLAKTDDAYSEISQRCGRDLMGERPTYKKLLMLNTTKALGRRVIFSMRLGTFLHTAWARRLTMAHRKERGPREISHDCVVCGGADDGVDHILWV